jgi:hypothetical protein
MHHNHHPLLHSLYRLKTLSINWRGREIWTRHRLKMRQDLIWGKTRLNQWTQRVGMFKLTSKGNDSHCWSLRQPSLMKSPMTLWRLSRSWGSKGRRLPLIEPKWVPFPILWGSMSPVRLVTVAELTPLGNLKTWHPVWDSSIKNFSR